MRASGIPAAAPSAIAAASQPNVTASACPDTTGGKNGRQVLVTGRKLAAKFYVDDGAAGCLPYAIWQGKTYVLLGKRSRWMQNPGTWAGPSGAIDGGETPAEAALRELREELSSPSS